MDKITLSSQPYWDDCMGTEPLLRMKGGAGVLVGVGKGLAHGYPRP